MVNWISSAFNTVSGLGENIGNAALGMMGAVKGLISFSNEEMLAFFGVLFAVASIDGNLDEEELSMILSSPELERLNASDRQQVQSFSCDPPSLEESLQKLTNASQELKFGLVFYLCHLVWSDGSLDPSEQKALELVRKTLKINRVQIDVIEELTLLLGTTRDNPNAWPKEEIKDLTERMKKVGIPVTSFFSAQECESEELEYSDDQFLEKMKFFGLSAGRGLVEQAYVLWYVWHDPNTCNQAKLIIAGALAYWILPVDMIPDVLPVVGFSDDLSTITAALANIAGSITPNIQLQAKQATASLFGDAESIHPTTVEVSSVRLS